MSGPLHPLWVSHDHARLRAHHGRLQPLAEREPLRRGGQLTDAQRKEQRGAFFGSIHGTLNHLLWGDQMWMSRFAGTPQPKAPGIPNSSAMYESWDELKRERARRSIRSSSAGPEARSGLARGRPDMVLGRRRPRGDQAQVAAGHALVQPPDASPRPGALHADPMRREAGRYGLAVPALMLSSRRCARNSGPTAARTRREFPWRRELG